MSKFTQDDCSIFDKYAQSVSWNDVPENDKLAIKSIRERLKNLAIKAKDAYQGEIEVKEFASHPTPNGRTPKELWCCIYPKHVGNKSYGLQIALIAMANGFEICFCMGAGAGQIANQDTLRTAQDSFRKLQIQLQRLPSSIPGFDEQYLTDWNFRQKWKLEPGKSEFDELRAWLDYASSSSGGGASISTYISKDEIDSTNVADKYLLACEQFQPLLDCSYRISTSSNDLAHTNEFLQIMNRYRRENVVFLSPGRNQRYLVTDVDEFKCKVERLDANEPETITADNYRKKVELVESRGGSIDRAGLDNTVARHITLLQGSDFGLDANAKTVVWLKDTEAAANHLRDLINGISSPQLYKPAILKLVFDGVATGQLTENRIAFDWLLPRFVELFESLGKQVGEQQLAEGYGRLASDLFWLHAHKNPGETLSASKPTAGTIRKRISHALFKAPYWNAILDPGHNGQLQDAIEAKWPELGEQNNGVKSQMTNLSINEATKKLVSDISNFGFVFQPWQIATYVTALRTKPFVILAGVSGTGKSKLPALIAKFTGAARPRRIAVKPDWTDSADAIGFVNLQNDFQPGVVLQEMRAASNDSSRFHVALIDEMNIARVEHYFAEVLSAIEDRKAATNGGYESSPIVTQDLLNDSDGWGKQVLPPNLGIVGTVNMDESTHGFSRKVLDRAFTIELSEIELDAGLSDVVRAESNNESVEIWPREFWNCPATRLAELELNDNREKVEQIVETLIQINVSLQLSQLQIGYRTRDEIILFVLNAEEIRDSFVTSAGETVDPLDLALMMKVLPRIVGGNNSVRRTLLGLLGIVTTGMALDFQDEPTELINTWEEAGRPASLQSARFPRTASRLCLMWDRLDIEGFTSFWL